MAFTTDDLARTGNALMLLAIMASGMEGCVVYL